jgi:hypothetical protein
MPNLFVVVGLWTRAFLTSSGGFSHHSSPVGTAFIGRPLFEELKTKD